MPLLSGVANPAQPGKLLPMVVLNPAHPDCIDSALLESELIVEDPDEPRQLLTELLSQALPAVRHVDAVATLAAARARMREHAYGLVLVYWDLPDSTSEGLIGELVAARPRAVVIVATIHDDDAHVFPVLRASATGYILKAQPRAVVVAQLQRIEKNEPALSPSIALRVLQHFRGTPPVVAPAFGEVKLTDREEEVLRLIAKGYMSPEVAALLGISTHTVINYVRDIYRKLGITSGAEAAMEAACRGLVGLA